MVKKAVTYSLSLSDVNPDDIPDENPYDNPDDNPDENTR
jgi:hypothetical protein